MIRTQSLAELAAEYVAARDICPAYGQGFIYKAKAFSEWAGGGDPSLLDEANLSRFLQHLKPRRSPSTVANYRGDLLVLWRWLADSGRLPAPQPRKIMRPKVPLGVPDCWSVDEVRQLLAAADKLEGRHPDGVPRRLYWVAAIRLGYETGLRRSDVWRIRLADIHSGTLLVTVALKTGVRLVHTLTREAVAALKAIGRPLPLAWPYNQRNFGVQFDRLVRSTSVRRGTFKWLRRTSGSWIAAANGEAMGAQHLGHTSLATFRKFYDARLVAAARPMPPVL